MLHLRHYRLLLSSRAGLPDDVFREGFGTNDISIEVSPSYEINNRCSLRDLQFRLAYITQIVGDFLAVTYHLIGRERRHLKSGGENSHSQKYVKSCGFVLSFQPLATKSHFEPIPCQRRCVVRLHALILGENILAKLRLYAFEVSGCPMR